MLDNAKSRASDVLSSVNERVSSIRQEVSRRWSQYKRLKWTPERRYYLLMFTIIVGFIFTVHGMITSFVILAAAIFYLDLLLVGVAAFFFSASLIGFLALYVWAMM